MIVPTTKGGFAPSTEMPSEANLLMALSEMHKQGRFKVAGDVVQMPGAATPAEHASASDVEDINKQMTNRTLRRALGGAKVLPMTPKDKD